MAETKVKVGDKIRINFMRGEPFYEGREGYVEHIDDLGHIFGTWGGLALIETEDDFEIIGQK